MEKFKKWLLNMASNIALFVLLPITSVIKGICNLVDIFIDSQKLTDFIEKLNKLEEALSNYDGSK